MSNISVKKHGKDTLPAAESLAPLRVMRRLLGWDPFQQMAPFIPAEEPGLSFTPAFEVKETKDAYEFRADIPGVDEGDIEITVTGNRLSISGSREAEVEDRTDRYFATERLYGSFVRTFTLPDGVDSEHVTASLASGVLRVIVPKKPETQPKKITVSGAAEQHTKTESKERQAAQVVESAQATQQAPQAAKTQGEPAPHEK
ncbi:MAG TPA: Hsp20/alpha crystallin family protein [Labilithrix sp.]|nr:Hsp20/alpha crystallin family protein [Labilithrix sp.]